MYILYSGADQSNVLQQLRIRTHWPLRCVSIGKTAARMYMNVACWLASVHALFVHQFA